MVDLTTVAAVKAYIGKTDPGDDGVIAALVTSYSEFVRSWTNRDFTPGTYEIWRSGRGQTTLYVPQWPLTAVSLLEIDGKALSAAPSFGAYGYRLTDRSIELTGGAWFCSGANNIHVLFAAGSAVIPSDITQAVNELVALRYQLRGDKIGWTSKSLAGETVSLSQRDMPLSVATLLKQYSNMVPL